MELYLTKGVSMFLLPPGINLLLGFVGLLLLFRYRRTGVAVILVSLLGLYALSTPIVANSLSKSLEEISPYPLRAPDAESMRAIIVLGGGRNHFAPEYGGETISKESLVRLRYAARLQRKTGLPILVTGGNPFGESIDEATLMKRALVEDFQVPVKWVESKARNTEENAQLAAKILKLEGIHRGYVVSHAAHLRRAVDAFKRAGMLVIPAPTGFEKVAANPTGILAITPSASALKESAGVFYEKLGGIWYSWRYE